MTNYYSTTIEGIETFHVDCDTYGNPRHVIHFADIPYREQRENERYSDYAAEWYAFAVSCVPAGKRYRARWFGGGVVFQSYDPASNIRAALDAAKEF